MPFWRAECFGKAFVEAEAPIDVSAEDSPTSEPKPDALVLKQNRSTFTRNPQCDDISLLVGFADSTLQYDLMVKALLYVRAGIIEYLVLDLKDRRVVVHRDPVAGQYPSVIGYREQEALAPLAAPDARFASSLSLRLYNEKYFLFADGTMAVAGFRQLHSSKR